MVVNKEDQIRSLTKYKLLKRLTDLNAINMDFLGFKP